MADDIIERLREVADDGPAPPSKWRLALRMAIAAIQSRDATITELRAVYAAYQRMAVKGMEEQSKTIAELAKLTLCTCGVVSGGQRVFNPGCPVHSL